MQIEKYKLENAYRAINKVASTEGLKVSNVKVFTTLLKGLEPLLIPYFDERRDVTKTFTVVKEGGKPEITDQIALQEAVEELAKQTVEFSAEKFNVTYGRGDKWLTVEINKALTDLYGDLFNLVEVD